MKVPLQFISGLFLIGLLSSTARLSADQQPSQPNIILVMADDLGINGLGCYGSQVLKTPNIDELSRTGIKFNCAYSGSTVCAPARCILMTGQNAGACSVRSNSGGVPLPESDVTIAELLKSVGYATGGFGKWALGTIGSEGDPLNQGFDEFYGYYHQTHAHGHYAEYIVDNGKRIKIEGNIQSNLGYEKDGLVPAINPATKKELVYIPYLLMDQAESFIRKNANRPFFCYLPVTLPHGHFHIPAADPAAKNFKDRQWSDRAKAVGAMTELLDRQVGELMALLKELEIEANTIVMFCSDHGAALRFEGELDASKPFRGFKRSMYEGGLRIPLIVHWPAKIKSARATNHVVYLGDLFATLQEIACQDQTQLDRVNQMLASQAQSSVSFAPTLLGQPKQESHEFLLWDFAIYNPAVDFWAERKQALRQGDWKILHHSLKEPWELYDLKNDPTEQKNLADEFPDRVARMKKLFSQNRTDPPRQHEMMLDWKTPFTWANKDRPQRLPPKPINEVVAESDPKWTNIEFGEDARMLGMIKQTTAEGIIYLNIAWHLKANRRPIRFIHVCDNEGRIVRQFGANRTLLATIDKEFKTVDSIVFKPEQLEGASFVAIGFYDANRGTSIIKNHAPGTSPERLNVLIIEED